MLPDNHLSKRELEVVRLLANGLSNRKIAEKLKISTNTVENHLRLIYAKLSVKRRSEAVAHALTKKLIELSSDENYDSK